MKDVDLKKLGTLRLCGGGALVALATWGVWAFCGGGFSASSGWESAFGGWKYGREDQKAASAALAAAGLDEWSWDDGRLLVPKNKKSEYQTALADAGAYPKAPSESRRDAIREMGAFESETKTRMRDLVACASQLEQTLEKIDGVEYATVGVRARREQAGLTAKTVVTASIGVACREGCELDANLTSAITVAAKHQLGVDLNENISILDLKAGKSYFGSENLVGNGNDLLLAAEKERVETYWRDKLLKTFDYMDGARVSVAAELVVVDADAVVQTELDAVDGSATIARTEKAAANRRGVSAAERLAQAKVENVGEIEKPRTLATWSGTAQKGTRNGAPFARLGNPVATRVPAAVEAQNLARVEQKTKGNGVISVGATERRDSPSRGVVPAGYREDAENEEDAQVEPVAQVAKKETLKENETSGRSETVAQVEKKQGKSENKNVGDGKNGSVEDEKRVCFRVRALAVRVGTPRGYVRRVAQNLKAENALETFATDETFGNWSALYQATERKIIEETKNVALLLLRPLAERNGWSENELTRSVAVDVFTDPNDFAERLNDGRDAENNPNGAFEVVANFGQKADTAERVAEETTVDAANWEGPANETAEEPSSEPSEKKTAADFWAFWKERALRSDAKTRTIGAAGVGVLTILALTAVATARRRKKASADFVDFDDEENKGKSNDAKLSNDRNKGKKRNNRNERNVSENENAEDAETAPTRREGEKRPFERRLRIARIEEKKPSTRDEEVGENDEGTRNVRQNPPIRRLASSAQNGVAENGGVERKTSGSWEDAVDFDDYDDWDELDDWLEIRASNERKRTRVGEKTAETGDSNVGDATRRREALDLVARNPERAAASLRRWLRPGA